MGRLKLVVEKMFILHNRLCNKIYIFHIFTGFEFGIYRIFIVPNLKCVYVVCMML